MCSNLCMLIYWWPLFIYLQSHLSPDILIKLILFCCTFYKCSCTKCVTSSMLLCRGDLYPTRTSVVSWVIRRVSERDPKINAQLTSVLWLGEAEGAFKVLCCRSPFSCQTAQSGETQPSLSGLKQLSEDPLYYYCYYYYYTGRTGTSLTTDSHTHI